MSLKRVEILSFDTLHCYQMFTCNQIIQEITNISTSMEVIFTVNILMTNYREHFKHSNKGLSSKN